MFFTVTTIARFIAMAAFALFLAACGESKSTVTTTAPGAPTVTQTSTFKWFPAPKIAIFMGDAYASPCGAYDDCPPDWTPRTRTRNMEVFVRGRNGRMYSERQDVPCGSSILAWDGWQYYYKIVAC